MNKTTLKTIWAIAAGLVIVFVLSAGTDTILEKTGLMKIEPFDYNPAWVIFIAIAVRCVYFILGGYVTARLAPNRPTIYAMTIGLSGLILGIAGGIWMWDKTPHWFPIVLAALPLPSALIGAKLKK